MSSSDQRVGELVVTSPYARLHILDPYLRSVAGSGSVGRLGVHVAAGAYRVTAHLAGSQESRLVVVRPGAVTEVDLPVLFDAAAPVPGTATENETHGMLAEELTGRSAGAIAFNSTLVIILRGLRGRTMAPLKTSLRVLDGVGRAIKMPVSEPDTVELGRPSRARGWTMSLPEGWYRIQWSDPERQPVEHGVWLSAGWQTVIFVPQGPHGPVLGGMSTHLVPQGQSWRPYRRTALAVEHALADMRGGSLSELPPRAERDLDATANPMLALLTAHLVMRSQRAPIQRFQYLAGLAADVRAAVMELHTSLGPHPDVLAIASALGVPTSPQRAAGTSWPPMLAASLDLLIARDRASADVVAPGSVTEAVSGQRYAGGPWLLWDPTDLGLAARGLRQAASSGLPPDWSAANPAGVSLEVERDDGESRAAWESDYPHTWGASEPKPSKGAMSRVRELVVSVADRDGIEPAAAAARLGSGEIAVRLGMLTSLVDMSLVEMAFLPVSRQLANTRFSVELDSSLREAADGLSERSHSEHIESGPLTVELILTSGGRLMIIAELDANALLAQGDVALPVGLALPITVRSTDAETVYWVALRGDIASYPGRLDVQAPPGSFVVASYRPPYDINELRNLIDPDQLLSTLRETDVDGEETWRQMVRNLRADHPARIALARLDAERHQ